MRLILIQINHEKYNHLSCSLVFWVTGKFDIIAVNETCSMEDNSSNEDIPEVGFIERIKKKYLTFIDHSNLVR